MRIKEATSEDIPLILELAKEHYLEVTPKNLTFDEGTVVNYLQSSLKSGAIIYVSDDGFILGTIITTCFGDNKAVYGPTLYIRPRARNGFTVRRFIRAFMNAAKDKAKYVYADTYNHGSRAFEGFLGIEGFTEVGKLYIKEF